MLNHSTRRMATTRTISGKQWEYQETTTTKAKADRIAAMYADEGLKAKVVKGHYDDDYHVYTRPNE